MEENLPCVTPNLQMYKLYMQFTPSVHFLSLVLTLWKRRLHVQFVQIGLVLPAPTDSYAIRETKRLIRGEVGRIMDDKVYEIRGTAAAFISLSVWGGGGLAKSWQNTPLFKMTSDNMDLNFPLGWSDGANENRGIDQCHNRIWTEILFCFFSILKSPKQYQYEI